MPASKSASISRRSFVRAGAAASAVVFGFPSLVRARNLNGRVQVASVGVNGMGLGDVSSVGSHSKVHFVGFCDVDTARFGPADARFPGVRHFQDFREMFAKLGGEVDAVTVSTPDHMHAFIAMKAMRLGKHVYCQKPLAHTVWECRQMRRLAEARGLITQMGNQIHSATEYRTAVKLLRDDVIGKVREVHSWIGARGNNYTRMTSAPAPGPALATLNWEIWTGTAPLRKFTPDVYHPFKWRDWQDFGSGALGDFGCHVLDPIFTALEISTPRSVLARHDGWNSQTWPGEQTLEYEFPGTRWTVGTTLKVTWHDGGRKPDLALAQMPEGKTLPSGGSLVIGEGGTMVLPHVGMPQLYPVSRFQSLAIEKVNGGSHYHAWVDGILANKRTSAGFHYAGPLAETVQLGNVATRFAGRKLEWDAARMRIPNLPAAEAYLTKKYRAGWRVTAA